MPAADPKLVAVVEQNKAGFEKCMADNLKKYPQQDAKVAAEEKKLEAKKDKSMKDLQRLLEIATQDGENLSNRLTGAQACSEALESLAKARLKAAGADDAASAAALEQWRTDWHRAHP
jgi:hypothetical protein